ncbi:hypothetical protein tpqmel_0737 [Candidatus Gastranaerophilus sp. (ex Termes propinquus)]|nr:hypothetical protein tpqmel_0737 [Candidatus Gastranaerophilus sp. (ex Termes propinquus)]
MKKFLITLFLLTLFSHPALAAWLPKESNQVQLARIEQSIWGFEYSTDSDLERIKRLEESVLGSQNTTGASHAERINILNNVLGFETPETAEKITKKVQDIEGAGIAYPVVDKLEMRVLGKTHSDDNVYTRLERLEKTLYGEKQNGESRV